jgi:hypothetical protein
MISVPKDFFLSENIKSEIAVDPRPISFANFLGLISCCSIVLDIYFFKLRVISSADILLKAKLFFYFYLELYLLMY